ncbi:MAG: hypothetical protein ACR2JB_11485 [Bryobacteraceae bacterium]
MTLGSCSGLFGLPTVMETTLGYFGMPEHRLMREPESQSERGPVWSA